VTATEQLVRQVRSRTADNRKAIALLHGGNLPGQVIGVLRQEVDSLVRVIYLLSIHDRIRRDDLIHAAVEGRTWTADGSRRRITDRDMVDLAQQLHGWTESVYSFGCAFIHLSKMHDHAHRDPFLELAEEDRSAILSHMRQYHGGPLARSPSFQDLVPYLPHVFEKIADNLECYVQKLENDEDFEGD